MHQYRGESIISHPDLELTLFIFTFARFQSSFLSTVSPCKFGKYLILSKVCRIDGEGTCTWKGQLEKREVGNLSVERFVMKLERIKLESSSRS